MRNPSGDIKRANGKYSAQLVVYGFGRSGRRMSPSMSGKLVIPFCQRSCQLIERVGHDRTDPVFPGDNGRGGVHRNCGDDCGDGASGRGSVIVRTRYRDIPFEEYLRCEPGSTRPDLWEAKRGQPIEIIVPASARPSRRWVCEGPYFYRADGAVGIHGYRLAVCPHIAEIGD